MAIGTILAIGSALGSLVAGGVSAVQNKKAKDAQDASNARMQADNEAWYNRRFNEDPTQRADAQAYLTQLRELQQERAQATAGQAAVMGSTDAAVAAQKAADTKAEAGVVRDMVASNETRKDNIEQQYMQTKLGLQQQAASNEAQYRTGISNAVAQAASGLSAAAAAGAQMDSAWSRGKLVTTPVNNQSLGDVNKLTSAWANGITSKMR